MLLFDRLALVIFSILVPIIVNATATNPESKSEDGIERCKGTMAIVNLFTPRNSIGRSYVGILNLRMIAKSLKKRYLRQITKFL